MKIIHILSLTVALAAVLPSVVLASNNTPYSDVALSGELPEVENPEVENLQNVVDQAVFSQTRIKEKSRSFSVLSNNVFLLGWVPWVQRTRAQLISQSSYINNHDVVVLQECFNNAGCTDLKLGLRSEYPYETPTVGQSKEGWDSTSGKYVWKPENGGVAIHSRWPITKKRQFIFMDACGFDKLSNKGIAYVELDVKGTKVHVFGTHMQANDSLCKSGQAASIRANALDDFYCFMLAQRIPTDELVIMAGDFNIDRDSDEFRSALDRLRASPATEYEGHLWSYDTEENEIARERSPNDPRQNLDHILISNTHQSVKSLVETTLMVHSPPYERNSKVYHEYSDHYPVHAVIELGL
ncbi:hypothetical protein BGX28_000630 [Mortierella sp. GBA30]|nr:hypothetical protein BGX28_000630 [Mortierella sp. GBA30]